MRGAGEIGKRNLWLSQLCMVWARTRAIQYKRNRKRFIWRQVFLLIRVVGVGPTPKSIPLSPPFLSSWPHLLMVPHDFRFSQTPFSLTSKFTKSTFKLQPSRLGKSHSLQVTTHPNLYFVYFEGRPMKE